MTINGKATVKSSARLAMEFWAGVGKLADVRTWAEHEVSQGEVDSVVYEMLRPQEGRVELQLAEINGARGFSLRSSAGKRVLFEIIQDCCRGYLDLGVPALELCRVVRFAESNFRDLGPVTVAEVDGAGWLVDLWNACDWLDASSCDAEALRAAARIVLNDELIPK